MFLSHGVQVPSNVVLCSCTSRLPPNAQSHLCICCLHKGGAGPFLTVRNPGLCPTINLALAGEAAIPDISANGSGGEFWELAHPEWLLPHWPFQGTCNKQFPKPKVPEAEPRASSGPVGTNSGLSRSEVRVGRQECSRFWSGIALDMVTFPQPFQQAFMCKWEWACVGTLSTSAHTCAHVCTTGCGHLHEAS